MLSEENEEGSAPKNQSPATSLFQEANSDDDLQPQQLSGDENCQKSLLVSQIIGGTKANFLLSVATIMKTVIGAGILTLPYTVSKLGYIFGIFVFIFMIATVQFTSVLLLKAKNLSKHSNFSTIGYHTFRTRIVQVLGNVFILITNMGVCIVQLGLIKQIIYKMHSPDIPPNAYHQHFYQTQQFILILTAAFLFSFAFVSKIQRLRFLAFFGITGITLFLCTFMIVFFILIQQQHYTCKKSMQPFGDNGLDMAIVLPNLILAITYHMNFFPIFKGMKNARDQKMAKASLCGVCACSLFYVLMGNMGYCLIDKQKLEANFLRTFDKQQVQQMGPFLYYTMNVGFLISITFSFPIMFFGGRNNFIAIINAIILGIKKSRKPLLKAENSQQQISSYIQTDDKALRKKRAKILFYVYTITIFGIAVVIAAFVQDTESVFNIVGAIASNSISFIMPPLFYFALIHKKKKTKKIQYYLSIALFLFFVPFGLFSVITKFLSSFGVIEK